MWYSRVFLEVVVFKAVDGLQYHVRMTCSLMYRFDGREIDRSDGFLVSFERSIDAVNFALTYQATIPQRTKLNTRIVIHLGVMVALIPEQL